jgi:hypothetical protein
LNRVPLHGEGGKILKSVVYLQGSLEYFGVDHLPYAIPAVLVLIFLSLPPPLLLISYPLLWKIKAKLRRNADSDDDTTVWLIRKLLPLIDSFQGVFKDNRRMFAGLIFLWRFILAAISTFASSLSEFFFLTEIALITILAIHTLARPYKRQLYNVIDGVMLFNMAVIILLKWYISVPTNDISDPVIHFATAIQLLLMYAPLVGLVGAASLMILKKFNIISGSQSCSTTEEDAPNVSEGKVHITRKMTLTKQKTADEDLFSRAAEINSVNLSSSVTHSEAAVEFETIKTTSTALSSY